MYELSFSVEQQYFSLKFSLITIAIEKKCKNNMLSPYIKFRLNWIKYRVRINLRFSFETVKNPSSLLKKA